MTHDVKFGHKQVKPEQKKSLVKNVFDSVASKYDLMNDLMSLGMHRLWKREFLKHIPLVSGNYLDMAAGSGDISAGIIKHAEAHNVILKRMVAADINVAMLQEGQKRMIDRNLHTKITMVAANAEVLPFPDNYFDCYTISFGIRNVTFIDKALSEAFRVLKPGGKFMCLEFAKVGKPIISEFYHIYSQCYIPTLGKIITGSRDAYQYLVDSIATFPDQTSFADMIRVAGFKRVGYENLTSGITAIHHGVKHG